MIPTHILNELKPGERVAVLTRGGEIHFHVHAASDARDAIVAFAEREGSGVLASHMKDHAEILALVASRERDVGGDA